MEIKSLLFVLMVIFAISMTAAHTCCPCRRNSYKCPQEIVYFSNLATPSPTVIETIDHNPKCRKLCGNCSCNDQLILPPLSAELPCGLGYFPAASPLVAKNFAPAIDFLTTGAYIPVASPCDSLIITAPVSPDIAPMVKSIIL